MSQLLLTSLGVVCSTCDDLNPPGTARCASCGTDPYGAATQGKPLAGRPAAASPPLGARPISQPGLAPGPAAQRAPAMATPGPLPAIAPLAPRTSGPKEQPPGLASRAAPAGIRPTTRPGAHEAPPQIPPLELVVKRPPATSAPAPASKFSLAALAGTQRGQRVRLTQSCQIGRSRGQITFADDPFLSPLHASLMVRDGRLFIKDESSTSGTFVSIPGQEQIQQNAYFSAGLRLFRFMGQLGPPASARPGATVIYGAPPPPGHLVYGVEEILVGNRGGRAVVTGGALLTIGTSKCDLTYASEEGMATRHCELSPTPAGALLRDLSGGLGTFVRLGHTERLLNPGDKIRLGSQVLQVEM